MAVYSRESEDLTLALSEQELELCGRLRLTPTVAESWRNIFLTPDGMATSKNAAENTIQAQQIAYSFRTITSLGLTSSAEDFPAKTSAKPEGGQVLNQVSAPFSGRKCCELLASYDRGSQSWKTFQLCFNGKWEQLSGTWSASGTTQNGMLFRLAPLVPHIHASGCSLWPTPRVDGADNAGGSNSRKTAIRKGTYLSGRINPNLYEWLMGFPTDWTALEDSETP